MKKFPSPSLAALAVALLAAPAALAMDQRQADTACGDWKLECPQGATIGDALPKKTGVLECKVKGSAVKDGPSVNCTEHKALSWGDWKAGKKHGLQVTLRPKGSWTEEWFAQGKPEGRTVEYSADGQLLKETHFHDGKKHGPERSFKVSGQLALEEFWDKGAKSKKPVPVFGEAKPAELASEAKPRTAAKAKASKAAAAPAAEGESAPEEATPVDEGKTEEAKAPASEGEAPAAKEDAQAESPQP
jgi:hypothetical protein